MAGSDEIGYKYHYDDQGERKERPLDSRGVLNHTEDGAEDSGSNRQSQQDVTPDQVQADRSLRTPCGYCVDSENRHHGQQNTQYDI